MIFTIGELALWCLLCAHLSAYGLVELRLSIYSDCLACMVSDTRQYGHTFTGNIPEVPSDVTSKFRQQVTNLLESPLVNTCALAQIHQLTCRQQLICPQLNIHLSYLTNCRRYEVAGHIRGFCQVCKIPADTTTELMLDSMQ